MPATPASHRDLLDGQFATLATIAPDGRPRACQKPVPRQTTRSASR